MSRPDPRERGAGTSLRCIANVSPCSRIPDVVARRPVRATGDALGATKMDRPEMIEGHEDYVITAKTQNLPKVQAFFEKNTGMLERLIYFNDSYFGLYPTEIDYRDYREVNGRKVPYQWVISQTRNREFTYAMQTITAAPVEDARFRKPAASSR